MIARMVFLALLCVFLATPAQALFLERELMGSIRDGKVDKVKEMIDAGADVHRRDPVSGKTPMELAMENPNPGIIALLMAAGAGGGVPAAAPAPGDEPPGPDHPPPEGWRSDLVGLDISQRESAGMVRGQPFKPDSVIIEDGVVRIKEQGGEERQLSLFLFLSQDQEGLPGQRFDVNQETYRPHHVHLKWKDPLSGQQKVRIFVNRYTMRLEFDQTDGEGRLPGRIHLSLTDPDRSVLEGTFLAQITQSAASGGDAARTDATLAALERELAQLGDNKPAEQEQEKPKAWQDTDRGDSSSGNDYQDPMDKFLTQGLGGMGADEKATPGAQVASLLMSLAMVAGMWMMFKKAGRPGWWSVIPFYNLFVMVKIADRPTSWFWQLFIIPMLAVPFAFIVSPAVAFFALFYILGLHVAILHGLSRCFGKGSLFTVGLLLFPYLFFLILGAGSDPYEGPVRSE